MQGIAFTDEIGEQEIGAIVQAAQKRLANTEQVALTVGPALVDPEAIMLEVHPLNALTPVRSSIRAAIADVQGPAKVPEADEWTPHISLAYSNGADPAAPYIDAINAVIFPPVELTVSTVRLIELSRDTHLYEWKTIAEVPLSH